MPGVPGWPGGPRNPERPGKPEILQLVNWNKSGGADTDVALNLTRPFLTDQLHPFVRDIHSKHLIPLAGYLNLGFFNRKSQVKSTIFFNIFSLPLISSLLLSIVTFIRLK